GGGRVRGDYLQWDYDLGSPEVERIFTLSMDCFMARNFGEFALNNRIMGTRFDIEVVRQFHKDVYDPRWLEEGKALSTILALDTADGLEKLVGHVKSGAPTESDAELVDR